MTDHYHLWCQPCQHEYSESQAERREVDGIWGEGRWWFCPECGARLDALQVVSAKDQEVLAAVTRMLVRFENKEQVPAEEIYAMLLEMGHSYQRIGRDLEACLVFYNASVFAWQNDLPENTAKVPSYNKIASQWNVPAAQYQIPQSEQKLMEAYLRYFLPI
jgi:rubredoxin